MHVILKIKNKCCLALGLLFLFGCALGNRDFKPQSQASSVCGVTAPKGDFPQSAIRGHLVQYCAKCHAGSSLTPAVSFFADNDPSVAFAAASRFMDVGNPSNSIFVQRMRNSHNCNSNCQTWGDTFRSDIEKWAEELSKSGETSSSTASCDPGNGAKDGLITTDSKTVASNLSSTATKLIYDLGNATPSMPGSYFEVTIQRYMNQVAGQSVVTNNYVVRNPTLNMQPFSQSPQSNIQVSRLSLLFNGDADALYQGFISTIAVVLPVTVQKNPIPFSDLRQLVEFHSADGDQLSFQFAVEKSSLPATKLNTNPFACNDANSFYNNVFNILSNNPNNDLTFPDGSPQKRCVECHGVGQPANPTFPMGGTGINVCEEFKKRNLPSGTLPAWDVFVTQPGTLHQGMQFVFSSTLLDEIKKWKEKEQ